MSASNSQILICLSVKSSMYMSFLAMIFLCDDQCICLKNEYVKPLVTENKQLNNTCLYRHIRTHPYISYMCYIYYIIYIYIIRVLYITMHIPYIHISYITWINRQHTSEEGQRSDEKLRFLLHTIMFYWINVSQLHVKFFYIYTYIQ